MTTLTVLGSRYLDSLRIYFEKEKKTQKFWVKFGIYIGGIFSAAVTWLSISACILYMTFDFLLVIFLSKLSKNFFKILLTAAFNFFWIYS